MNRSSLIAEGIRSWPIEVCAIVADYAIDAVRWSERQDDNMVITNDRTGASLPDVIDEGRSYCDSTHAFRRLLADRRLRETEATWTIQFINPHNAYVFRIGVVSASELTERTVSKICSPNIAFRYDGSIGLYTIFHPFPQSDRVRFSLSANIKTGRLSGRVWSIDRPAVINDWFSVDATAGSLADSIPVVYLYGEGSTAVLTNDRC